MKAFWVGFALYTSKTKPLLTRAKIMSPVFLFIFQRIDVFVKQNNFLDALELALSFYNGTAMAVIGKFFSCHSISV